MQNEDSGKSIRKADFKPRYEQDELTPLVWEYFRRGNNATQTARIIRDRHRIPMRAGEVLAALQRAAQRGQLRYRTPDDHPLRKYLLSQFSYLQTAQVVTTALNEDLAEYTARLVVRLIRDRARSQEEVRIGLSGGRTTRSVIQSLAHLLETDSISPNGRLTFIALVSGFDVQAAGADPTAFFIYLDRPAIRTFSRFVLLHAPSIIRPDERKPLLTLPAIAYARREAENLDIILTSAADFDDEHSMLRRCYDAYGVPAMLDTLTREGCIGDMMWMPLKESGWIDCSAHQFSSMTLISPQEITDGIVDEKRRMRVVLTAGPCTASPLCHGLKDRVLHTILSLGLNRPTQIVTDVVVDSRTARKLKLNIAKETPERRSRP